MELPPLPEIFGNYAIRGIAEVQSPDAVSWIPATAGWKFVAAISLAVLARMLWRLWRRWRFNRYRRTALTQLASILARQAEPTGQLSAISLLLKATALQVYPRTEVAALSGEQWICWLNSSAPEALFPANTSRLLSEAVFYRDAAVAPAEIEQLASRARAWIRQHEVPAHA